MWICIYSWHRCEVSQSFGCSKMTASDLAGFIVQDHLRKTSILNRQLQFPPVSSRVRANCLMENTTTSSSIRRELQWRKVDLDKKLYVSNTFPQHMTRICCWSRKKSETNPSRPRPRPKVGRPRPQKIGLERSRDRDRGLEDYTPGYSWMHSCAMKTYNSKCEQYLL